MTTSDAAAARSRFVAAQVAALAPLDFVLVGPPAPPFDAVRVLREADGSLAVALTPRDEALAGPYSPEQVTAMARVGLGPTGQAAIPPADPQAAAALVESVLAEVLGVPSETAVDVRHGSEREARAAEERVRKMRSCIEPVLAAMSPDGAAATQDEDGDYVLDIGRVRVFVAPRSLPGRPPPIIRVFAITNAGVNLSSELGLFLARLNFSLMFGRFSIDTDNASIWFEETLLGEQVTDEELRFTVEMVAATANEWDQKLAGMFGGRTRATDAAATASPSGDLPNKPGQGGYL